MQESLNEKLQRVESSLTTIKNNLHFEANAIIEDVAASTDIKRLTNVFVQQNEPSIKDGIWVQCDEKENAFDKIIMDREMIVPYKWQLPHKLEKMQTWIGLNRYYKDSKWVGPDLKAVIGDTMYFYEPNSPLERFPEYDLTQETRIAQTYSTNRIEGNYNSVVVTDGTYLYFCLGSYSSIYVVDPVTKTQKASLSGSTVAMSYSAYDGCVYFISGTALNKINPNNNFASATVVNNNKFSKASKLLAIGEKLLVMGSEPGTSCMVDLYNDNSIITNEPAGLAALYVPNNTSTDLYGLLEMEDSFVIYNSKKSIKRYNKNTLEMTEDWTELFQDDEIAKICTLFLYKNVLHAVVTLTDENGVSPVYLVKMDMTGKTYDSNAVIISQAPISRTEHQTALWTYDGLEGRMTQSFYDIFYYNKDKGFMKEYPIYYGDGTKWIKFKN